MKKFWAGFITGVFSSIIAAYLFTVLAVPPLVNINQYKEDIETTVQKLTRINFTIDELIFDIDWALNLKLEAKGLKVGKITIADDVAVQTPAIDVMMGKQNLQLEFISAIEEKLKKNINPKKAITKIINENLDDNLKETIKNFNLNNLKF